MGQQASWESEYTGAKGIPTSTRTRPSSAVVRLIDYLKAHGKDSHQQVLDIGCGTGRNSIFLAQQGFHVTAVDFAKSALEKLCTEARAQQLEDSISIVQCDLTKVLPFADDSFDIVI